MGASYLLEFFVSSKLHSNIGDDSGHIGSVPLEIASEALLSPNAHQCRDDASKLLTHTIYLDLCVCVCVCVGSCTVTNIHCHEYSFFIHIPTHPHNIIAHLFPVAKPLLHSCYGNTNCLPERGSSFSQEERHRYVRQPLPHLLPPGV